MRIYNKGIMKEGTLGIRDTQEKQIRTRVGREGVSMNQGVNVVICEPTTQPPPVTGQNRNGTAT